MRTGGGGSQSVVRLEDGRGKNGHSILVGTELLRLPRVWEGLGIQPGVAQQFFSACCRRRGSRWKGRYSPELEGGPVWPLGGRERRYGIGKKGQVIVRGGWADLLQGGVVEGPWGFWGEQ